LYILSFAAGHCIGTTGVTVDGGFAVTGEPPPAKDGFFIVIGVCTGFVVGIC
jgi:hypothetical protein